MDRKLVLLLNPPGDKTYLRDYYCSKVSKTDYIYQPTDLLLLSGILFQDYDIQFIDAIADRLSIEKCKDNILKINPDIIVFLTGSVSKNIDFDFMKDIRGEMNKLGKNIILIGTGDVFMEGTPKVLQENDFIDAALLDFTTPDILVYLQGGEPSNMIYRKDGKVVVGVTPRDRWKNFEVPMPRHELFKNKAYKYPFVRKYPFATVLTDYGCPFRCSFCIMSEIGFKTRGVKSVVEELSYLKKLGFKNIYFNDQTFGTNRVRAAEISKAMIENKFGFGWVCFSRADVMNEELLLLMKQAGCHTIMFGVESGSQEILNRYQKDLTKDQLRAVFALCKKHGVRTLGTFIIGLPGETRETIEETLNFSRELNPDFVAFNVPVPRMGTDLRKEALESELITPSFDVMDQSGSYVTFKTTNLSTQDIAAYKKRAVMEFYLRPNYIFHQMQNVRSFEDLKAYINNGYFLFKNLFSWSR